MKFPAWNGVKAFIPAVPNSWHLTEISVKCFISYCAANQTISFYMKYNTGMKWFQRIQSKTPNRMYKHESEFFKSF